MSKSTGTVIFLLRCKALLLAAGLAQPALASDHHDAVAEAMTRKLWTVEPGRVSQPKAQPLTARHSGDSYRAPPHRQVIHHANTNSNSNSNRIENRNTNIHTNRNAQSQGQYIRDSGNSSSRSTGIGVGGHQSQSSTNTVRAGNNNGHVSNAGNNTGTSHSTSSASQSNQNSSTGNSTTTFVQGDTYVHQAQARNPVSSAVAAALTSGHDSCMGSTSVGAQGVSFGISFGGTWTDDNCIMLKNSTMLWNMGKTAAAVALMCGNPKVRAALEVSGTPCPPAAGSAQDARWVRYEDSDPHGSLRYESFPAKAARH